MTGLTPDVRISKPYNATLLDQYHASSVCISAYAYLARKFLGLRDTYIPVPKGPPPPDYNELTPDFWLLTPEKFEVKHKGERGELILQVQQWYKLNINDLDNCKQMFEIDYMPLMDK